jgi:uncharacterized membrane protein
MLHTATIILTLVAAIGSGLVAGIWFAFSTFVMRGLSRIPSTQGLAAMQSINVAVLNPIFFLAFFGAAAVCLGLLVLAYLRWGEPGTVLLLAGSLLYLVFSIGVTAFGNAPLNETLAAVAPDSANAPAAWSSYVSRWLLWNHARLIGTTAAAICLTLALWRSPQG